jgi:hypothetical protein
MGCDQWLTILIDDLAREQAGVLGRRRQLNALAVVGELWRTRCSVKPEAC